MQGVGGELLRGEHVNSLEGRAVVSTRQVARPAAGWPKIALTVSRVGDAGQHSHLARFDGDRLAGN
jgi:hypothetical protein